MTDQPVHPLFRDKPPPEAKLWRYLSFAKFASLLDAGQLHFTRVDRFDDHFEGAWPQQDAVRWQQIPGFTVLSFTERCRKQVAASCWFQSKHESAAMWGLYASGNEGVAITTSFRKLDEVVTSQATLQPPDDWITGTGRVRYIDHFTECLDYDNQQNPLMAFMPFTLKNVSYEHENEVRALVIEKDIAPSGVDIPVQPANFIDEIVINPFSQPWFDKTVRGVADRYGLGDRIRSSTLSPLNFYITR